jgi:6-phosphogluconate dehydrogenase
MDIGIVGLGKMGANMAERLARGGHRVVATDRNEAAVKDAESRGAVGAPGLVQLVGKLPAPRAVWLMIPSGAPVDAAIAEVTPHLAKGDTIIDGGNSNYKDSMRRAQELAAKGLHFVDVGTSGGIWGLKEGYSLMIGGDREPVERLRPVFETLAPSRDTGWGHVGPSGAGHFVKMIHNGIEYGMMQAYAEGFAILNAKKELNLDLPQISEIWRVGSVVRSWLLDLIAKGLSENPTMQDIRPFVQDSGEGRWTVAESIDLSVAAPVITLSLQARFRSRDEFSYSDRLLAVMRQQFGGHAVTKSKEGGH